MELSREKLVLWKEGGLCVEELREQTLCSVTGVDHVEEALTYEEFLLKYLLPNRPCVLGPWVTKGWRSRQEWVKSDMTPHLGYIRKNFGAATVPVANCDEEKYSSHPKEDVALEDYIKYLEDRGREGSVPQGRDRCLYLKDWHFTREFPEYEAYTTPEYFTSDWLNEFWDTRSDECDDYRFVYIGPKGSWTPFHADVLRSYSWSANICGRKMWWIYPPGQEEHLKDKFGQLVYDLRSSVLEDQKMFPNYPKVGQRLEVIQSTGEIIFIPSGWHHQVFNLEDTISINHNWLNGCSVDLSWAFLKTSLADVQQEISDYRGMDQWTRQCQLILKATSGIDYAEFYKFLHMIGQNRLDRLHSWRHKNCQLAPKLHLPVDSKQTSNICDTFCEPPNCDDGGDRVGFHEVSLEETGQVPLPLEKITCLETESHEDTGSRCEGAMYHFVFDLMQIGKVLKNMLETAEFSELLISEPTSPHSFLHDIDCACSEWPR